MSRDFDEGHKIGFNTAVQDIITMLENRCQAYLHIGAMLKVEAIDCALSDIKERFVKHE